MKKKIIKYTLTLCLLTLTLLLPFYGSTSVEANSDLPFEYGPSSVVNDLPFEYGPSSVVNDLPFEY